VAERFPDVLKHTGMDPSVSKRLLEATHGGEWMSDVEGVAVRLLVRDVVFQTDTEYDRWNYEIAGELFAKPFYRVLMYVVSPTLVMLGATKRWAAFREGSVLTSKVDRDGGTAELRFPPNLYPDLVLRGFGEAFRASLSAARARNPKVVLDDTSAEHARWLINWD
jgi:hypothetical protein